MSRMKMTERVALELIQDAEASVDRLISNAEEKVAPTVQLATTPEVIELRRLAVFGQALLTIGPRALEWRVRPNDVAGALRRLVTPTPEERQGLGAMLESGAKNGAAPAVRTNQTVRELVDAEGRGS
jgi:hypothetical protein